MCAVQMNVSSACSSLFTEDPLTATLSPQHCIHIQPTRDKPQYHQACGSAIGIYVTNCMQEIPINTQVLPKPFAISPLPK